VRQLRGDVQRRQDVAVGVGQGRRRQHAVGVEQRERGRLRFGAARPDIAAQRDRQQIEFEIDHAVQRVDRFLDAAVDLAEQVVFRPRHGRAMAFDVVDIEEFASLPRSPLPTSCALRGCWLASGNLAMSAGALTGVSWTCAGNAAIIARTASTTSEGFIGGGDRRPGWRIVFMCNPLWFYFWFWNWFRTAWPIIGDRLPRLTRGM
jgi:hypothetical protein